tara:strand:+ start:278 stop:442 length:165 start_codon:yes stop_codon:yes gene_type:complete
MALDDNPFDLADSLDCSSVDPLLPQRLDVAACGFFRRLGSPAAGHIWESLVDQQ